MKATLRYPSVDHFKFDLDQQLNQGLSLCNPGQFILLLYLPL